VLTVETVDGNDVDLNADSRKRCRCCRPDSGYPGRQSGKNRVPELYGVAADEDDKVRLRQSCEVGYNCCILPANNVDNRKRDRMPCCLVYGANQFTRLAGGAAMVDE